MIPTHKTFRITPPVVLTEQERFLFQVVFVVKPALTNSKGRFLRVFPVN